MSYNSWHGQKIFSSAKHWDQLWGPSSLPRAVPRGKVANWEADHSYVSTAGVRKGVTVLMLLHMASWHAHGQLCLYLIFWHMMAKYRGSLLDVMTRERVREARETDRWTGRGRRSRKRWRNRRRRRRKNATLEFKLPSCFSFVYAFFVPNFHHMAITHHILRKTRGGGRYFAYQAEC
jgi:hypothetical protein